MSSKLPLITVLMPAYNVEKYIAKSIQCILDQTVSDFELLIINDVSTDGTLREIAKFSDPRIRVVSNEQNLGPQGAANRGLKEARGQYIARLDSDDLSIPTRLEKQLKALHGNPHNVLVSSWIEVIDQNG